MSKLIEKSLVIKKETSFEKIRKKILMAFFKEEYEIEKKINELVNYKKVEISKIVIPREIKI